MSSLQPENNAIVLANTAELATLTVLTMMSNENVREMFARSLSRTAIADAVMASVNRKLSGQIRDLPTGQFDATVKAGQQSAAIRRSKAPAPATQM